MTEFSTTIDEFLGEYFAIEPLAATDAGNHDHDHRWPDLTETGRVGRLAFADRWLARFGGFGDEALSLDERADRDVIVGQLEALRFHEAELRTTAWDPLEWVELMGVGLFLLLAREFAPRAVRLASFAGRLDGLASVVDAAEAALVGLPEVPVSKLHAEAALSQLGGIAELVDEALGDAEQAAPDDPATAELLPFLRTSAASARAAVDRFERHVRQIVLPSSSGEGRLGAERFAGKLRHTLQVPELTPERLLERAESEAVAVRAEMVRLARELWPAWCPDEEMPDDEQRLVRGVLDRIATEHPAADEMLDACREELARIEAFCRDRQLIGLPAEPLELRWTPTFLAAFGGASLWSPGPLDRHLKAYFLVTPIPPDWSEEQTESWLREMNDRQIRVLTIHEAVPGHYLQGVYANRNPSLVRTIFGSGVFAEGWAVYVTQIMIDAGYGADDPALMIGHWKFYLRAVLNVILDVRVHTRDMTEDEAIGLLVGDGFQEESEARNKYRRARLTSTQLSTYFVGSAGLWDLDAEVRRRAGAGVERAEAAERGGEATAPGLPGGPDDPPGWERRAYLETVISHGTPPLPVLRRLVLGDGPA